MVKLTVYCTEDSLIKEAVIKIVERYPMESRFHDKITIQVTKERDGWLSPTDADVDIIVRGYYTKNDIEERSYEHRHKDAYLWFLSGDDSAVYKNGRQETLWEALRDIKEGL